MPTYQPDSSILGVVKYGYKAFSNDAGIQRAAVMHTGTTTHSFKSPSPHRGIHLNASMHGDWYVRGKAAAIADFLSFYSDVDGRPGRIVGGGKRIRVYVSEYRENTHTFNKIGKRKISKLVSFATSGARSVANDLKAFIGQEADTGAQITMDAMATATFELRVSIEGANGDDEPAIEFQDSTVHFDLFFLAWREWCTSRNDGSTLIAGTNIDGNVVWGAGILLPDPGDGWTDNPAFGEATSTS